MIQRSDDLLPTPAASIQVARERESGTLVAAETDVGREGEHRSEQAGELVDCGLVAGAPLAGAGDEVLGNARANSGAGDANEGSVDAAADDAALDDAAPDDAAPEDATAKRGPSRRRVRKAARPAFEPIAAEDLPAATQAILLAAGQVVKRERLVELLALESVAALDAILADIRRSWEAAGLPLAIDEVAGGLRVVTRPAYAAYVERLDRKTAGENLTRALVETLGIVAYKQPVGRAEVERIRGVQAAEALRQLLERGLIKVVGRSEQPGRPLLYGTTERFLVLHGLSGLDQLPTAKDLQRL